MATLKRDIRTTARPGDVWDAIRDVGALHTRLVPGFVADTRLEAGARIVTFSNGTVVRETIVTMDDHDRRLVWSASGASLAHHNGSVQVFTAPDGATRVVWIADFLPDAAGDAIGAMMDHGMTVMKQTLDRLAETADDFDRDDRRSASVKPDRSESASRQPDPPLD